MACECGPGARYRPSERPCSDACRAPAPSPPGSAHPGQRSASHNAGNGPVDPRPAAMRAVRDAMDRIYPHGGAFIISPPPVSTGVSPGCSCCSGTKSGLNPPWLWASCPSRCLALGCWSLAVPSKAPGLPLSFTLKPQGLPFSFAFKELYLPSIPGGQALKGTNPVLVAPPSQRCQHDGADDHPLIEAAASQHMNQHSQPDQS